MEDGAGQISALGRADLHEAGGIMKKRNRWDIFPEELFQGLRVILMITFGGIALFYGGWNFPYPTAIVVMVVSVGFLVWTRKWFQ